MKKNYRKMLSDAMAGNARPLKREIIGNRITVTLVDENDDGSVTLTSEGAHMKEPVIQTLSKKQYLQRAYQMKNIAGHHILVHITS